MGNNVLKNQNEQNSAYTNVFLWSSTNDRNDFLNLLYTSNINPIIKNKSSVKEGDIFICDFYQVYKDCCNNSKNFLTKIEIRKYITPYEYHLIYIETIDPTKACYEMKDFSKIDMNKVIGRHEKKFNKFIYEEQCCICLTKYNYETDSIIILPCNHLLHEQCNSWVIQYKKCPICLTNI